MTDGGAVAILAVAVVALGGWGVKQSKAKDDIQELRIQETKEYAIAMTKAEMQSAASAAQMARSVANLEKITSSLIHHQNGGT